MKRLLATATLIALAISVLPNSYAAIPKTGAKCSKAGATSTYAGKKLTCIKSGKKLIWNKGVKVSVPNPVATPTPNASATPTLDYSKVILSWVLRPVKLSKPGTLNDPNENSLQDNGFNSSFVVQATLEGKRIPNLSVSWSTSDSTSHVEAQSGVTDSEGKARAWFISGTQPKQLISAKIRITGQGVSAELSEAPITTPTLGRAVVLAFKPPFGLKDVNKVEITGTVNSAPKNTYFAFANFSNFYTGIQMVDCATWTLFPAVCDLSRGAEVGHEGHFSVWDGVSSDGKTLTPKVVEVPSTSLCKPFNHEGSGQMCFAKLDWKIGTSIRIVIERIDGAPKDYQRLRVTAVVNDGLTKQLLAVIDAPGGVNLSTEFASFNENWELNQWSSCLTSELRSITFTKVNFFTSAGLAINPTDFYSYGSLVSLGQTICENYGVRKIGNGLEVFSGGTDRWIDIAPSLAWNTKNGGFRDLHQATIMLRDFQYPNFGG